MSSSAMAEPKVMESGKYSDLTVSCRGKMWTLHEAVAVTLSGYLKAAKDFGGEKVDPIPIEGETPQILQSVFEWMYTGTYRPPPHLIWPPRKHEEVTQDRMAEQHHSSEQWEAVDEHMEVARALVQLASRDPTPTMTEVMLHADIAVYACADFLIVEGLCLLVAECFLMRVAQHYNEDWFPRVLEGFCERIGAGDPVVRPATFKLLLGSIDDIKHDAVKDILKEQEPIAWYAAVYASKSMKHERNDLLDKLSKAYVEIDRAKWATRRMSEFYGVIHELERLIEDRSPRCKGCNGKIKTNWGQFTIKNTGLYPWEDGNGRYFVYCRRDSCNYRQYLN